MAYDNTQYWTELHRRLTGQLVAVGYPNLSERFNELKYQSEAETLMSVLQEIVTAPPSEWRILDVGAGTGYWTCLVDDYLRNQRLSPAITALDISAQALETVKTRLPAATSTSSSCPVRPTSPT